MFFHQKVTQKSHIGSAWPIAQGSRKRHLPDRHYTGVDVQTSWYQGCSGTSHRVVPCSESTQKLHWLSSGLVASWGPPHHDRWRQTWPSRSSAPSPCWARQSQEGCEPSSQCVSWRPPESHWLSNHHSAPCGPHGHSWETPEQERAKKDGVSQEGASANDCTFHMYHRMYQCRSFSLTRSLLCDFKQVPCMLSYAPIFFFFFFVINLFISSN